LELIIKIRQSGFLFLFLKYGEFGSFFSWKMLCIGQDHIFQVEFWQKFARRREHCFHEGSSLTFVLFRALQWQGQPAFRGSILSGVF
jgi:hypothetical protein